MDYFTSLRLNLSRASSINLPEEIHNIFARHLESIRACLASFQAQPLSPTAAFDLERWLAEQLRVLGCDLLDCTYNRLEGDNRESMPSHYRFEFEDYRIVGKKTPHQIDTLFGPIRLNRHMYRPVHRDSPEKSISPLERLLGVVEGVTPAMAEAASRYAATAGASQRQVLDQLRTLHGVTMGTERLRDLLSHISGAMAEARQECQVVKLLELLQQAEQSVGRTRPVLNVSRDGISLCKNQHSLFEVATAATVWVTNRRGNRLGTIYLAFAPELGQHQMSDQLTKLLEEVLRRWEGSPPRLAYVTDAGDNETKYYQQVLRPMVHPRTGEKIEWVRVVDFFHAMERVWKMADVFFGDDTRGRWGWGRRMGKLLKKPNGLFRILHAAAALKARRVLSPVQAEEYRKAYNYLTTRSKWMRYSEYARLKLPLGSGIVEAACKTIFTQRLKLSGMRWTKLGAQVILDLRVVLLSGVWEEVYRQTLVSHTDITRELPAANTKTRCRSLRKRRRGEIAPQ